MKKHNFYAGPAILPQSVIQQTAEAVKDFAGMGLSIMEISHRSKPVVKFMEEAVENVKKLFGLSDDYSVLFLTGGASSQFFMSVMNLADENDKIGYVNTGTWSDKALKEAKKLCKPVELASSKDKNYTFIPKGYDIPSDLKYIHVTSNNTVFGTQFKSFPECACPLIGDMSSDIFSRKIAVEKFGLIYAGAQKNVGLAGTTLVIVRKDILGKISRTLPSMLDYRIHIDKESSFNTPPVLPIYTTKLNLDWILENGGVDAMEKRNNAKAKLLYTEIDSNPLFDGTTASEDRSVMNATFLLKDEGHNDKFLAMCKEAGVIGIEGHRSVGGFRASMYNAMDIDSVQVLVSVMQDLANKVG
jgi:phosphoserine aminotransferase